MWVCTTCHIFAEKLEMSEMFVSRYKSLKAQLDEEYIKDPLKSKGGTPEERLLREVYS